MASRILRTLLAPAAFAAVLGQESCLGDDVSLMQIAALTGKAGAKAVPPLKQAGFPAISSMTDNTGFLCIEGDAAQMANVSFAAFQIRDTPLAQFNSHMAHVPGANCSSRGYTQSLGPDLCQGNWANSTVWVREGTTRDALQYFRDFVQEKVALNGRMRHLPPELVDKWVSCVACGGGVPGEGYRWYGQSTYPLQECTNIGDEIQTAMRAAYGRTGSYVPDTGVVCFEGAYQYMVDSLAMAKHTPYSALFTGEVQEGTCAQRGYDKLRDAVDDCWPLATTNVRSATEAADTLDWAFGERGFMNTLSKQDAMRGMPAGLSANLTACFACQAGGPFRDRGMILLPDAAQSNGGYTTEQCHRVLIEACVTHPDSGASPNLCERGITDFTIAFRERAFEPVPNVGVTLGL